MNRTLRRVLLGTVAAVLLTGAAGGVASATEANPAPNLSSQQGVPIWLLPGVDLGSLLGPTVPLPTQALAPVDGLLTLISG